MKTFKMLLLAIALLASIGVEIVLAAEEAKPPAAATTEVKPPEKPPEDKVTGSASMAALTGIYSVDTGSAKAGWCCSRLFLPL